MSAAHGLQCPQDAISSFLLRADRLQEHPLPIPCLPLPALGLPLSFPAPSGLSTTAEALCTVMSEGSCPSHTVGLLRTETRDQG